MGIVVCVVFIVCQHHQLSRTSTILCNGEVNGHPIFGLVLPLSEELGKIESYHLWIEYFPFTYSGSRWKEELDANEFAQIEVKFVPYGLGFEVTKCGAHLIFEQEIEDLKQTKPGSSSCIITPYYEANDRALVNASSTGTVELVHVTKI